MLTRKMVGAPMKLITKVSFLEGVSLTQQALDQLQQDPNYVGIQRLAFPNDATLLSDGNYIGFNTTDRVGFLTKYKFPVPYE